MPRERHHAKETALPIILGKSCIFAIFLSTERKTRDVESPIRGGNSARSGPRIRFQIYLHRQEKTYDHIIKASIHRQLNNLFVI